MKALIERWRPTGVVLCAVLLLSSAAAAAPAGYSLRVVNVSEYELRREPVVVGIEDLPQDLRRAELHVLAEDGRPVPVQVDDLDGDGRPDELVFLIDCPPGRGRTYRILGGSPAEELPTSLRISSTDGDILVRNEEIALRAAAGRISFVDPASGKAYLTNYSPRGPNPRETGLLTSGPVRAVLRRTLTEGLEERFTLYCGLPTIRYEITKSSPGVFLRGNQAITAGDGELIAKNNVEVEEFGTWSGTYTYMPRGWYESNRTVKFIYNPTTGCSVGMLAHRFESIHVIDYVRDLNKIKFGAARTYPLAKQSEDRHTFNRKYNAQPVRAEEGRPASISMSFCFFRLPREKALAAYERYFDTEVGVVNVYGEGGKIIKIADAPRYIREDFRTAERWRPTSGGVETRLDAAAGTLEVRSRKAGEGIQTALVRNFVDPTELRGELQTAPGTTVRFLFEDLDSGKTYELGTAAEDFRISVSERVPVNKPLRGIFRVELLGEEPRATFKRLRFAWPLPAAPRLATPPPQVEKPLSAEIFNFKVITRTPEWADSRYEIQVSGEEDFSSPQRRFVFQNHIRHRGPGAEEVYRPEPPLEPGRYWWRARAYSVTGDPGPWSETAAFTLEEVDGRVRPLVTEISARRPMLILPTRSDSYVASFLEQIPEKLHGRIAAEVMMRVIRGEGEDAWFNRPHGHDYPMFVKFTHKQFGDLTYLEYLFNRYDRVLGYWFGESGNPGEAMFHGIKLVARRGRIAGLVAGGRAARAFGAREEFYDLLRTRGEHLTSIVKSQFPGHVGARYSDAIGLWMGRGGRWGTETEFWAPAKIHPDWGSRRGSDRSKVHADLDAIDFMPPFLMGLAAGAQFYRVEAFFGPGRPGNPKPRGWNKNTGQTDVLWNQAIGAFFTDLLEQELVPTREQVLTNIKVAFQAKQGYLPWHEGEYPGDIIAAVHGRPHPQISGGRQWLPGNPRCFIVPTLPVYADPVTKRKFASVVYPDEFASPEKAIAHLNRYYPPYGNEAFAWLLGDTGVIANTENWVRAARPQRYELALDRGPVSRVSGRVDYNQYWILKQSEKQLFLHANNYPGKTSTISLHGQVKQLRVQPASALVARNLAEGGTMVTLTVSHDHPGSVVRVFVR